MTQQHARGAFEVTITPDEPGEPDGVSGGIARFRLEKTWSGELTGSSRGLMLSAGDPAQQRAGYVALEEFEGSLGGTRGGFVFQQLGIMRPDAQELTYVVVPGSGSGDLADLEGTLALDISADGTHAYDLTYTLG